jgi:hypothetical protein
VIALNVRQPFRKKTKIEKINSKVKFEIQILVRAGHENFGSRVFTSVF